MESDGCLPLLSEREGERERDRQTDRWFPPTEHVRGIRTYGLHATCLALLDKPHHIMIIMMMMMMFPGRGAKYVMIRGQIRQNTWKFDVFCTISLRWTHYNVHSIRGSAYFDVFRTPVPRPTHGNEKAEYLDSTWTFQGFAELMYCRLGQMTQSVYTTYMGWLCEKSAFLAYNRTYLSIIFNICRECDTWRSYRSTRRQSEGGRAQQHALGRSMSN